MIRKLRTGEYRLYSRKANPKTGKRRNLGTFKSRAATEKPSARCSISSGIKISRQPRVSKISRQRMKVRKRPVAPTFRRC